MYVKKKTNYKQKQRIVIVFAILISFITLVDSSGWLGIQEDTLIFNRDGKQVEINILAIVNGEEYEIADKFEWWKEKRDNRTWKFGGNITIPDTALGEQIANNLEEIVFVIHAENVTIGQLRKRVQYGFHYEEVCITKPSGFYQTCTYVDFNFRDIVQRFLDNDKLHITVNMSKQSDYDARISFDVRQVNFYRGQVIDLDPTIIISDVSSAVARETNIGSYVNVTHIIPDITSGLADPRKNPFEDLVMFYGFDTNTSQTNTYSYRIQTGTINGDAHFTTEGCETDLGNCMSFDGDDDYIERTPFFSKKTNFTVMFWINTSDGSDDAIVMSDWADNLAVPQVVNGWQIRSSAGGLFLVHAINETSTATVNLAQNDPINDSQWHHVVMNHDDNSVSWYFDGVQKGGGFQPSYKAINGTGTMRFRIASRYPDIYASNEIEAQFDNVMYFTDAFENASADVPDIYQKQWNQFETTALQEFILVNISQSGNENRLNCTIGTESTTFFKSLLKCRVLEVNYSDHIDILTTPQSTLAEDGLDAYFHLDNLTGYENDTLAFDFSGNQLNGTIEGNPEFRDGVYWGGIKFDGGDDRIVIDGGIPALAGTNVTVSAWIQWHRLGGAGTYYNIVTQFTAGFSGYELYTWRGGASHRMGWWLNSGGVSGGAMAKDTWYHIVGTHNDTHMALYKDGQLIGLTALGGSGQDRDAYIGYGDDGVYGNISVDEVIVWNRTLTATEIEELYYRGKFTHQTSAYKSINASYPVANFPIRNSTDYVGIDISFTAGNTTATPYMTPTLVKDLVIDTYGADDCDYFTHDYLPPCSCTMDENVDVDSGYNVVVSGSGNFITAGYNISGYLDSFLIRGVDTSNKCNFYQTSGSIIGL